MRVPFDLHHPQRRATAAGNDDRNAGAAHTGRGGEGEKGGGNNLGSRGVERAWEYWVTRLQKAEAMWAAAGLPRLRDLGKLARPQTAGLVPARSATHRASSQSGAKRR